MNKQKIVLFDIDYTLFDMEHFDKNFHKELSVLLNLDENLVKKTSRGVITDLITKESFIDIDKYINNLLQILMKKEFKKKVEDILFNSSFFKKGFYEEVEEALKSIKKLARIGIFSKGDRKLQWAKIEQSGFKDFFQKDIIYIGAPSKMDLVPEILEKHKNDIVYLIDDKPVIINDIKKYMPSVFTIWLKRGKYINQVKETKDFKPDATITNLSEVVKIVNKR